MRILTTGAAGFIGSHVADALLEAGHDVVVVDNLTTGRRENVPARARFIELDLAGDGVAQMISDVRPDVVIHHAAQADVMSSVADPVRDTRVNVLGTISLLHAAVQSGARKVIFASSGGAIYGEPQYIPCKEDHPINPISPYAAAKAAAEIYLQTFGRVYGLDYTILRYPNVYGPRQHPYTEEGQVVAIFARLMLNGRHPTIFGSGEQGRDFLYVTDVAAASLLALDRGSQGTFNLGSGELTTVNDLYRWIAELTGFPSPAAYAPERPGEVFRITLDATKARSELGWEPRISLKDGLARTVEWVRTNL
ncbi:MAG TPA: NAD-dependent epimerase/dehydratase family protein [Chloroflexota bacterium]